MIQTFFDRNARYKNRTKDSLYLYTVEQAAFYAEADSIKTKANGQACSERANNKGRSSHKSAWLEDFLAMFLMIDFKHWFRADDDEH